MQVTITKEVKETVNIELPYYCVSLNGNYVKILSESESIQVHNDDDGEISIRVTEPYMQGVISNYIGGQAKEIKKSVFDNELQSALSKLNAMFQKEDTHKNNYLRPETVGDADDLKHVNI